MKTQIMSKVSRNFSKVGFQLKKHSPEILIAAGVVGTIASAVMACKATTKLNGIIEESKDEVDAVHESLPESGSEKEKNRELTSVYARTGIKLVKLYAPAVVLGATSLTCIVTSNNILRKRNMALAAAYATVDKGFKEYRSRVIERFGSELDKELRYNIKAKEVEETITDEKGKEKKVKKTIKTVNPEDISGYARFFEEYTTDEKGRPCKNPYWNESNEYNVVFLNAQQRYANDLLRAKGMLFLNEVYDMLGLPKSKEGQIVGWVYDDKNPVGDNYVDFGLYANNQNYSDFVYGNDDAILLDFNVDGNIWEKM